MALFEDIDRFLEERLDEFLKAHPTIKLQVLADQLQQQQVQLQKTLRELKTEEEQLQKAIVLTAEDVQRWHERVQKAQQANRTDLVDAAKERENALLRQGSQQWTQMELAKQRQQQTQTLLQQVQDRRRDVEVRIKQQPAPPSAPSQWRSPPSPQTDDLEAKFKRWELEEELKDLKRQMGS